MASALLFGCSEQRDRQSEPKPGTLLADEPFSLVGDSGAFDDKAEAHYVRYESTSGIDGAAVAVSGMVLVPKGRPQPPDGYRLVSYGHGAVGFDKSCGPTATKSLGPSDAPRVAKLLAAGYVVAVADYQGLGAGSAGQKNGAHPFREPRTTGYNLVDAARAAKALLAKLGKAFSGKWAAYGESQGGEAAWAAGNLAAGYGSGPDRDGLALVGVAAEKPPTDFAWLVDGAAAGTLSKADQLSYLRLLKGLQAAHPELSFAEYVRGPLAEQASQDAVFGCFAQGWDKVAAVAARLSPADTKPTRQQADQLRAWLRGWTLPAAGERGPSVPYFVAASLQDEVVPVGTVRAAVLHEQQRGTAVHAVITAGGKHGEFDDSDEAVAWVGDRFAGRPAPDDY
ncbi:lipase family protein [Segniliparus rugosus]|uniref:Secretory lipase n=1 Tax=Segniliparus rugosus (strain ATCC BAA-974 / DSM 45345 / CCUG 50838 / CIP 108380 / JCM 13579 / CDC 945) TaxID=679197 RepID=E5XSV6_SEGRC|nr:lipase family protein [Segniliparus rugosus]EFV12572.1 hypothetical protein HMPREF9336_02578 [Segniliparus rugosus ATCC BAA-974]